ncbi:MAG: O-antigen ligase family protein [Candidatus Sungbacteria bacterium]|uniref:O-antigen ligase family protein n=1 Tax=Candidatus Sungiibacteriota bacterium TaxID=2750080 RepID=A0A9D6LT51_9BACT|nr:O-antigen ligase family protein [Candidatus Sungbacteria bacterium]
MNSGRTLEIWLSNIVKWGLFLILPLPLVVWGIFLFPYITGRNFLFRILIEILAALWVGLLVLSKTYRPRLTWLTRAVAVFLFVVTLADLFGINPYRSFWSNNERMEGLIALLHMVLFYFIASSVFRKYTHWKAFFYTSTAISLLVALYGLAQKFGLAQSIQGGTRVDGTIGNPDYLASYLMFHIFFLLFFLWRERIALLRWFSWAVIVFEFYIIYLTATRGVVLAMLTAFGLVTIVFAIRRPKDRVENILRRVSISALAVIIIAVGSIFLLRHDPRILQNPVLSRFATISTQDRTVQSRFFIWHIAWQGVKEHPVLGWGQENFYYVFNKYFDPHLWSSEPWFDRSHDIFFDWLIHAGVLGLLSYLSVLAAGFYTIWRAQKLEAISFYEMMILGGVLLAYFLQNIFVFDNFQTYFLLFVTLGFAEFLILRGEESKTLMAPVVPNRLPMALGITSGAGIVTLILIYLLNVKPMIASADLIGALQLQSQHASVNDVKAQFQKVYDADTFVSGEATEQLAAMVRGVLSSATPQDAKSFIDFAVLHLQDLTNIANPDAKHLLFLGSAFNTGVRFDQAYAQKALDALNKAKNLAPQKQQIYFELANTYLIAGNLNDAIQTLQRVVDLDPAYPGAELNLGIVALLAARRDIADPAIARYESLPKAPDASELERLVQVYIQVSDMKGARRVMEELLKIDDRNSQYWAQYAAILAALGDKTDAKTAAEKAAEIDPSLNTELQQFLKTLK